MKILEKHRAAITILAIVALMVTLSAVYTPAAYLDFWESLKTFGINIWRTIQSIFGADVDFKALAIPENAPPVFLPGGSIPGGNLPGGDVGGNAPIFDIIGAKFAIFGNLLLSGSHYSTMFNNLLYYVLLTITALTLIIPIIFIIVKLVQHSYFKVNNNHNQDTKPLAVYKKLTRSMYPMKLAIKDVLKEISRSKCKLLVLVTILLMTNIFTFAFAVINTIITNLAMLIKTQLESAGTTDLLTANAVYLLYSLRYIFTYLIVIIPTFLYYLNKRRYIRAGNVLESFEAYNQDVLSKCSISTYKVGAMGTHKTLNLTGDALSWSIKMTNTAQELKDVCVKMFPNFPWLAFDFDIELKIKERIIYNWSGCKKYIDELHFLFEHGEHDLYNYDIERYGDSYFNGICIDYLFEVLKNYSRLHFLWISQGSFIVSNYPIREDKIQLTLGNTVQYNNSFFRFDKNYKEVSYYSRILNFDILRLGVTFNDLAEDKGLEFGIICIAEDDKEQMNALETIDDSTKSPYPNPKNDGMSRNEKFIRHRATIMGHCFIRLLKDGQRAMSVNADTREISTIEYMTKPSKDKNTLPLFETIEKPLYFIFNRFFAPFDKKIRFLRGDNTLLHYILKNIDSKLYNLYYTRYNRYGFRTIIREVESGTLDGKRDKIKTYELFAKMLADRYNTATHEPFFAALAEKSNKGLIDYDSYQSTTMTDEEFDRQNSYSRKNMSDPLWKEKLKEKAALEKEERKEAEKLAKKEQRKLEKENAKNEN